MNRVSPRPGLIDAIAADLTSAGVPLSATRIGNRIALAHAMALGFGVVNIARTTPAAAETNVLALELHSS